MIDASLDETEKEFWIGYNRISAQNKLEANSILTDDDIFDPCIRVLQEWHPKKIYRDHK